MAASQARVKLSIRALLLVTMLTLGGLLAVVSSLNLMSSWRAMDNAKLIARLAKIDHDLLDALQLTRLERSNSATAFFSEKPDLNRLKANRQQVDVALNEVTAGLAALPRDSGAPSADQLRAGTDLLRSYRAEFDAALAQAQGARSKTSHTKIQTAATDLLDALNNATDSMDEAIRRLGPELGGFVQLKQAAWNTRVAAGEASLLLSTTLANRQMLTPEQGHRFDYEQGRAMAYWTTAGNFVQRLHGGTELDQAYNTAQGSLFGKPFQAKMAALRAALMAGTETGTSAQEWQPESQGRLAETNALAKAAMSATERNADKLSVKAVQRTMFDAALLALALVLTAIGLWIALRRVAGPLRRLTETTLALAAGDLSVAVPDTERADELGALAGAVDVFKKAALQSRTAEQERLDAQGRRAAEDQRVRQEAEQAAAAAAAKLVVDSIGRGLGRLAEGDLSFALDTKLPGAYEALRTDLNRAIANMRDVMAKIADGTVAIHSGSSEIAQASDDLSRRTEQQAATLEQTAAALDLITATVNRTAAGAGDAQRIASEAAGEAERSGTIVRNTVQAMGEIESSARQIEQIIGMIDEIAFQTSLLALNAGVEAARAGEAGRGFAVVASEVRGLAQRSADAAREIKKLIGSSAKQVDEGVRLVDETGSALQRITTHVADLHRAVAQIAKGSQEQAVSLVEVNTAVNQMDQVTQQNAAMVEQSTAASHALSSEADALAVLAGQFRLGSKSPRQNRQAIRELEGVA